MAHMVEAFVAEKANLEAIQREYGLSKVVELPHGFCLLPLVPELYDAIEEVEGARLAGNPFRFLAPKIGNLLLERSGGRGIVYFETDYFGGHGSQCAVYVKEGTVLLEPSDEPDAVNQALKLLGVTVKDKSDEFDKLCLGWFRSNEDWIEQLVFMNRPRFDEFVQGSG